MTTLRGSDPSPPPGIRDKGREGGTTVEKVVRRTAVRFQDRRGREKEGPKMRVEFIIDKPMKSGSESFTIVNQHKDSRENDTLSLSCLSRLKGRDTNVRNRRDEGVPSDEGFPVAL